MKLPHLAVALALTLAVAQQPPPESPPPLEVGAVAPTLRLNDDRGQAVTVGGAASTWTVLAFYPKALTPG